MEMLTENAFEYISKKSTESSYLCTIIIERKLNLLC